MNTKNKSQNIAAANKSPTYGIEFFHIYTDEKIGAEHTASLEYFKHASSAWNFDYETIILIDDYNPITSIIEPDEVLSYLNSAGFMPSFWSLEGEMIDNAKLLLESITKPRLKKQYLSYINKNKKYPCSLLTATWYLTRLGHFDYTAIKSVNGTKFMPSDRLVNILPSTYKNIEERAFIIIKNSPYSESAHVIQDLFFPVNTHRIIDLF
jgi:hypothetical protein